MVQNNGRLRISVSTRILVMVLWDSCTSNLCMWNRHFLWYCSATCTDGSAPKQLIKQRVYHKTDSVMTYYDRDAGTMTYHPTHGHMHVDNWGIFTLRTATTDPNPLNWPIVGNGAKLAFCLMDYGTCSTYNGHCVDSTGATLTNTNFPNFGLEVEALAVRQRRRVFHPVTRIYIIRVWMECGLIFHREFVTDNTILLRKSIRWIIFWSQKKITTSWLFRGL